MTVVVKEIIQIQLTQKPKGQPRQDRKDVPIKPLETPEEDKLEEGSRRHQQETSSYQNP